MKAASHELDDYIKPAVVVFDTTTAGFSRIFVVKVLISNVKKPCVIKM